MYGKLRSEISKYYYNGIFFLVFGNLLKCTDGTMVDATVSQTESLGRIEKLSYHAFAMNNDESRSWIRNLIISEK